VTPDLAVEEAAAVPVMIWSLDDFGAFLDYASRHRMAPLFEIAAGTGMRRGELCALPWTNVDLDAGTIHVTTARVQAGWTVVKGGPKTDARTPGPAHRGGRRHPEGLAGQQAAERLEWGPQWQDTGLVLTQEHGAAWHPDSVTDTSSGRRSPRTSRRSGCTTSGTPTSRTCSPTGSTPGSSRTGWATRGRR
jgi:hypothetical protein